MTRKGGPAHEQSLRELKCKPEELPFYQPAVDAVEADARKTEVMETMKTWNKPLGDPLVPLFVHP